MNKFTKFAIGWVLLIAAPLAFACDYPVKPGIPDGSTASQDELLAAKESVNSYLADIDEYLTCIEAAEQAAVAASEESDPDDRKRRDAMLTKKFEAANAEKELVGEEFNLEVRAYNAARTSD